jgi:glycerol-1-phosphate dehydrogenase [NAD(P)+]
LIVKGVKRTILSQPPLALFADLQTLSEAPHRLVAAGYGDMIGKITALADWALGAILWDEGFDQTIYDRSQAAIELCIANRFEIARQSLDGVAALMQALIESGFCMLDFGNSNPASGAEHHASHYWEMKLLREGRPALLHGAKVGFATIQVARRYVSIRALSRDELRNRLEAATLPDRDAEIAALEKGYGALADEVIQEHAAFLNLTEVDLRQLKQRIADCWDDVLQIAGRVPPPDIIAEYLDEVGAPTDHETLGLSAEEVRQGFEYGHYLRKRFTVMKLSRVLNLPLF